MKNFNKIYAKYMRKDYFCEKEYIRKRIVDAREHDVVVSFGSIKNYLKTKKEKCRLMMQDRINEFKTGKYYPKREKFTWAVLNAEGYTKSNKGA